MNVSVKPSADSRALLLRYGLQAFEVLTLDIEWNRAIEAHDPTAVAVGRRMQSRLQALRNEAQDVRDWLEFGRSDLNASWPQVLERWNLPPDEGSALDDYVRQNDGLGNAGIFHIANLAEELAAEISDLSKKINQLESGHEPEDDLKIPRKLAIGITAICAVVMFTLPIAGAAVGAAGVVAATLTSVEGVAGLIGGIVGSTLVTGS